MSGVLDISIIKKEYDISKRLGDTATNVKYYREASVFYNIEKPISDPLAIIFDCGLQDKLYGMSKAVHEKMVRLKIPHDYIERPGRHDWAYWVNAVRYQLLFFREFFNSVSVKT